MRVQQQDKFAEVDAAIVVFVVESEGVLGELDAVGIRVLLLEKSQETLFLQLGFASAHVAEAAVELVDILHAESRLLREELGDAGAQITAASCSISHLH